MISWDNDIKPPPEDSRRMWDRIYFSATLFFILMYPILALLIYFPKIYAKAWVVSMANGFLVVYFLYSNSQLVRYFIKNSPMKETCEKFLGLTFSNYAADLILANYDPLLLVAMMVASFYPIIFEYR
jgi:hypothetical protein